ncbi:MULTISPECIES: TniB family NTP-binding protein [Cyanophyceae]|uniref:TniB family NTP-binding protein n=1 Tax=Cyanophyceae TaxID=3028117 RepID=UPI001687D4BA|nr:TniB family NTP-binding protein [Trichocoleus sp. FACHB-69]MBD1933357.1 TniB family NTP-binding protein [Trichocoleus sp. FACHB-69]
MTKNEAKAVAQELGEIPLNSEKVQAEIQRLNRKPFVDLEQVKVLNDWLEGKRQSRQSGRVVGESRTGKTIACDAYRLRHKPIQEVGKPPTVPVVYIQIPQECGAKELFGVILEHLKYQMVKGTVAEIRDRTLRVLKGCSVEMLIIDEADRLKPKTFAEVRDIFDKLEISVILVGTDRLDTVIKRDEQVYNRFRACHRFGKLSGGEFKQTVEVWEKKVLQLPVASNLSSKTMLKTLGEATAGYIGLMDMILREAAIESLKKGLQKIDLETLKEVAAQYR